MNDHFCEKRVICNSCTFKKNNFIKKKHDFIVVKHYPNFLYFCLKYIQHSLFLITNNSENFKCYLTETFAIWY